MVGRLIEKCRRRVFALAAVGLLMAVQVVGIASPAAAGAAPSGYVASISVEQVWLVNATRYGTLGNLHHTQCLNYVAEDWAHHMAEQNTFEHNPSLVAAISKRCGGAWSAAGENIAKGYSSNELFDALMHSSGHKANILNSKYTRMGAAGYRDDQGTLYVAQVFADCSDCSDAWNEPAHPQGDAVSVQGWVDRADCKAIAGWSFDMANPAWTNRVDIYIDGGIQRSAVTDKQRPDVNQTYATWGEHGFNWSVPKRFQNGRQHKVEVYGITTNGGPNRLLASKTLGPCR